MIKTRELLIIISDLIKINYQRVDCYNSLMQMTQESDTGLREIFYNKASECKKNAAELSALLLMPLADKIDGSTSKCGAIFDAWKQNGNICSCEDRDVLLGECECGEEFALEAYKTALTSPSLNDYQSRKTIMDQKYALQISQDHIKKYRDLQELA